MRFHCASKKRAPKERREPMRTPETVVSEYEARGYGREYIRRIAVAREDSALLRYLAALLLLLVATGCGESYQVLERVEVQYLDMQTGERVEGYIRAGSVLYVRSSKAFGEGDPFPESPPAFAWRPSRD